MSETVKQAIKAGDLGTLGPERLEELGVDVNECLGSEDYTTLHWACHYGRAEVLEHLLKLGVDVTLTTIQGWTAAHICAIRGCTECLQLLCSEGVDLEAMDNRGYTCAHLAAAHGKCSVFRSIVSEGVDLSVADRRGWTVVHHAAFHGRLAVLQLVSKLEVGLLDEDKDGNTPVHLAAMEGHLDCLKLLVQTRTTQTISCRNNNGATPKDLAVQFLKEDCAEFLASLESKDSQPSQLPPMKLLTYDGKELPAHSAASRGNLRLLRMVIEEGKCRVDDGDPNGDTPSHLAAAAGKVACLQWLVDYGADVSLRNCAGQTPLDIARKSNQIECLAILVSGEAEEGDDVGESVTEASPERLAKAGEKVEHLERLLGVARAHYHRLGGVLREDEDEWRGRVEELTTQLEFERERREGLEVELDCLRRQFHQSVGQTDHYRSLLLAQQGSFHDRRASVGAYDRHQEWTERVGSSRPLPGAYDRGLRSRSNSVGGSGRVWSGVMASSSQLQGYGRPHRSFKRHSAAGTFVRIDHL